MVLKTVESDNQDACWRRLAIEYQPIVVMSTKKVIHAEALARFRSDDGLLVPPSAFMPRIEALGMHDAFTGAVAAAVATDVRNGANLGLSVSVNVWAHQIADIEFMDSLISDHHLSGLSIMFELLETTEVDRSALQAGVSHLQDHGFAVLLDDFGTGFSGIDRFLDLPVDIIKLDRSIVMHADHSSRHRALIAAVSTMAAEVGCGLIAEGVETHDQAMALRGLGVSTAQGFLFGRPHQFDNRRRSCQAG